MPDPLVAEIRGIAESLPRVRVYVHPDVAETVRPIAEFHGIPIIVSDLVPDGTALLIDLKALLDAPAP